MAYVLAYYLFFRFHLFEISQVQPIILKPYCPPLMQRLLLGLTPIDCLLPPWKMRIFPQCGLPGLFLQ